MNDISQAISGPVKIGMSLIIGFFGCLTLWSVFAPLSGAVIASGQLMPEGTTRMVQHLEGGIVEEILIEEGQRVTTGQPLIRLQDVQARSVRDELLTRMLTLSIQTDRLLAEQNGAEFWKPEVKFNQSPLASGVISTQQSVYTLRQQRINESVVLLQQKNIQMQVQIDGLKKQILPLEQQIKLSREESSNLQVMVDKGLEGNTRLLSLQRLTAQLEESRLKSKTEIARLEQDVVATGLEMIHKKTRYQEDVSNQLVDVKRQVDEIAEQLEAAEDVLRRALIVAPVSGTVVNLQIRTVGGVIAQGAPILSVVPDNEQLIVKAMVSPTDIDDVILGQAARVQLSAYSFRKVDSLSANVTTVSADLTRDEVTGDVFYTALLRVAASDFAKLPPGVVLTAGMPVEAFISTESRSVVAYLLEPVLQGIQRGLREP